VPGVEGQVERDWRDDPAQSCGQRKRHPAPFAQLSYVELPAHFQSGDEEEQRHQAALTQ
jgi:hypothetical protein